MRRPCIGWEIPDAEFDGTDYTLFAAKEGAKHCSSLCSQSEGHEHVANMVCALGHNLVIFQPMLGRRNNRPPHFASKVSYNASPQTSVECLRSCPCKGLIFQDRGLPLSSVIAHRFSLLPL